MNKFSKVLSEEETKPEFHADNFCLCLVCFLPRCLIPSILSASCCCLFPECSNQLRSSVEQWIIRQRYFTSCFRCCCYYVDLTYDCNPSDTLNFFVKRRQSMENDQSFFCVFNKVNIWDQEESERLLLSDQGRGSFLGNTDLIESHLPNDEQG